MEHKKEGGSGMVGGAHSAAAAARNAHVLSAAGSAHVRPGVCVRRRARAERAKRASGGTEPEAAAAGGRGRRDRSGGA